MFQYLNIRIIKKLDQYELLLLEFMCFMFEYLSVGTIILRIVSMLEFLNMSFGTFLWRNVSIFKDDQPAIEGNETFCCCL